MSNHKQADDMSTMPVFCCLNSVVELTWENTQIWAECIDTALSLVRGLASNTLILGKSAELYIYIYMIFTDTILVNK